MLDGLLNILAPLPRQLSGADLDKFVYVSIKDRHPTTLTKVIDQIHQLGANQPDQGVDCKEVISKLSRLKNRLQTDKVLEPLEGAGGDVEMWNEQLAKLELNTWFTAPWLVVECYMYRKIYEAFQQSELLHDYDYFSAEKQQGLIDSMPNIEAIGTTLLTTISAPNNTNNHSNIIKLYIEFSLWGNKTDLSIMTYNNQTLDDVQTSTESSVDKMAGNILGNDTNKLLMWLDSLKLEPLDIVLDNAGFELFGDLCLGEMLCWSGKASSVTFHQKCIPWFVSDVRERDMVFLLDRLCENEKLKELGNLWKKRFEDGTFKRTEHVFWSTGYGFSEMNRVSPELYQTLRNSSLVFFKGDLNYRKLVNDRVWEYDTRFLSALEGFKPAPVCALRTCKSDSLAGCEKERVENVLKEDNNALFTGKYAVISFTK